MAQVPSNLIPVRVTQLQDAPVASEDGLLVYVYQGNTYKIRAGDLLNVAGVPTSRQVSAGTGLTGGGALATDITLGIAPGGVGTTQLAESGVTPGVYGSATAVPVVTVDATGRVMSATTAPVAVSGYVPESRQVIAGTGLTGGGALNANVTLGANLSDSTPASGFQTGASGAATSMSRSDHTHPAVDLADDNEVDGVLGLSNGGTAKSIVPAAGALVWSGADGLYAGPVGVAGQVAVSGGTGTPTWGTALVITDQPANVVYAGPASGPDAPSAFRALVTADLPSGTGTVTSVAALTLGTTGTDLSSSVANGTTTPVITLNVPTASASNRGALSAADWSTFNSKQPAGAYVTSVAATAPVSSSGGTTPTISMAAASGSTNGYLTSTDWTTFNSKQAAFGSQTANTFYAGPTSGADAAPAFRAMDNRDLPTSLTLLTGGISTPDFVQFDTAATPTPAVGKLMWDVAEHGLSVLMAGGNVNLQVGQETVLRVYNNTGSAFTDGQIVYGTGSSGQRVTVALAQANSDATSAAVLGMVTEPIADGAEGFITIQGVVHGIDTHSFTDGQVIYLSPTTPGAWTATKPVAPQHMVLLGYVVKGGSVGGGSVYINTQNGYELDELHDVLITSVANQNLLQYNSAIPAWVNVTPASVTVGNVSGTVAIGNGGTGQTTALAGFNALSPLTTAGDLLYGGVAGSGTRLPIGGANTVLHGGASSPSYSAVTEADISLSANTTNNVSTARHGFCPVLPNNANQFLNGQGNYTIPSGLTISASYSATSFSGQTSVNVVHNFGTYPLVQVVDNTGAMLIPLGVVNNSVNDFTVTFNASTTGTIMASVGSPQPQAVTVAAAGTYAVVSSDRIIKVTSAGCVVTLPTSVGNTGREFNIVNASTGTISVVGTSSQTINVQLSQVLPSYSAMTVFADGANYWII